jgi:sialate O-acetylesterase
MTLIKQRVESMNPLKKRIFCPVTQRITFYPKSLKLWLTLFLILLIVPGQATVRLPQLISSGMILQREADVMIWGWADKNEAISLNFLNQDYQTKANARGEWKVQLKNLPPGGPHTMTIKGHNTLVIEDILIGDIWVCSGQSNMNYRLRGARSIYEKEIAEASNPWIRSFTVPETYNFIAPQEDMNNGEWIEATSETVLDFSAVSYFFAVELYKKYQIPIGLIHSSKSGSPAQAWISKEAIRAFPHYYKEAITYEDQKLIENTREEERIREESWFLLANASDKGLQSPETWYDPSTDISAWGSMAIPGHITLEPKDNVHGVFWFRKEIQIPADMVGREALLKMGRLVNSDSVYINGTFVGATGHQWSPRNYEIPAGLLKEGANTIVIRLINHNGKGGFLEGYPYQIRSGENTVELAGEWKYKPGAKMDVLPNRTQFSWKATGLYNGMISPLTNYSIKGVIWYQGEGNTGKPLEYESLFPCMIKNWRESWRQGDFPFLYVQLANFMEPTENPASSNWAMLRDAQRKTLSVAKTGMAVSIDIGEAHDVHPMNKKDVGYRLALEAQRVAYNDETVVSAGPLYKSTEFKGNKMVVSFELFGSSLKIRKGEKLNYFAIAGADQNFLWAQAKIDNNKIIVWHPDIPEPVAVRYAWANNPETANLVNSENLPASPFRTDDWEK